MAVQEQPTDCRDDAEANVGILNVDVVAAGARSTRVNNGNNDNDEDDIDDDSDQNDLSSSLYDVHMCLQYAVDYGGSGTSCASDGADGTMTVPAQPAALGLRID